MRWKWIGAGVFIFGLGALLGMLWPFRPIAAVLDFTGALIGAAAGIAAAFLAVHLQRQSDRAEVDATFTSLITRLEAAADLMVQDKNLGGGESVKVVYRAYVALMETAEDSRSRGAGIATIASRMRHSLVLEHLQALLQATNVKPHKLENMARAVSRLCRGLRRALQND